MSREASYALLFPRQPRGLLIDMDGTLTKPILNFAAMRREMGISGMSILAEMQTMGALERQRAEEVLERHERAAAEQSELAEGCESLLRRIGTLGIRTALVTRNSRASTATVLSRHGLRFDAVMTRDDGPAKPSGEAFSAAARAIGVPLASCWAVGDGRFDIEAAAAAGICSIWISLGLTRDFAAVPSLTIEALSDLTTLLVALEAG